MRTILTLRDSERTITFEPTLGALPEESPRYVFTDKHVREVPTSMIKLAATKVLAVSPEQLAAITRIALQRSPDKLIAMPSQPPL